MRTLLPLVLGAAFILPAGAQTPPAATVNPARVLVSQPIDETQRTVLRGNVSPLAQARYDQGRVDDSLPAERVLLMLSRPPEREAALQQYLGEIHSKGSANYHHWLTPQQFGERFGPADTDIQTVTNWLGSKGFRIKRVSQGKQYIEFSGTAKQLGDAFHAEIHQYTINGELRYSNSREISVPSALAGVVRGMAPLNNFRMRHYIERRGVGRYWKSTHTITPDWTVPNPFGSANPSGFLVSPEDLATQYDISPLYQAGTNGTGQTIGIIDESNIDLTLVSNFQQLFGLASNPPQVVIDGDDPGDVPEADIEAYLDVEIAGAIAPRSTVDFYISDGGAVASGLVFAAIRAVEDNSASVLSASFGECEASLGESGNQFWASLWGQAAAQGQTVMVATGDSGPVCNVVAGISVSGVASTPWNVAVGGTDFFYSDYASGGASVPSFWSATNDASLGSLKAPIEEQAWNDGFGLDVIPDGFNFGEIGAGGGGASSCAASDANTGACIAGYSKPSWQTGPGVPADGVRDVPDVSWFASNGANLSSYAICALEGECASEPATDAEIFFVGGTSASAPAMAGIMALVDQKFGRQGQADFTLYPLAQQKPAAFHDITEGSNSVPCPSGLEDCADQGLGIDQTTVYSAGPGYDLATGLGTIDANMLVTNWDSINFKPTTTNLTLSPRTITHGSPVTATVTVTSGSGTPTGGVSFLTNSPQPASQSVAFGTLNDGSLSGGVNFFPGGTYEVTARYGGDGTFGASTSVPVELTVNPEASVSSIEVVNNNNMGFAESGFSVAYNSPLSVNVAPTSVSAANGTASTDGIATGTATFKVDSTSATVPLDGLGLADYTPPALAVGAHTVSATYSGDASFNASTAAPITFNVTKGAPALNDNIFAPIPGPAPIFVLSTGASLMATVQVAAQTPLNGTAAPTGNVTVCLGTNPSVACLNPIYSQNATLAPPAGLYNLISTGTVTFPSLAAGDYVFSFTYTGDANWQSTSFVDVEEILVQAPAALATSSTTLSFNPTTISGGETTQVTTTVTGSGNSGVAPTGLVDYYDDGLFMAEDFLTASGGQTATARFLLGPAAFFNSGPNQITAIYQGDANYLPSTSNTANVTATQVAGNFTMTPQASEVTLQPGASTSVGIGLAATNNFSGMVTLNCTTSSAQIMCSVPGSTMLDGVATPMMNLTASAQAEAPRVRPEAPVSMAWPDGPAVALASLALLAVARRRRRRALLALGLCAGAVLFAACGGGGGNGNPGGGGGNPPPNAATYTVIVSASANGMVHNAKITVFVP